MKKKLPVYISIFFVLGFIVFTFLKPEQTISPGKLITAHKKIESDCFACHKTFGGVTPEKCTSCHKVDDIGIKTTDGKPIDTLNQKTKFHQNLTEDNCLACHTDHLGRLNSGIATDFSHNLIDKQIFKDCIQCHSNPKEEIHTQMKENCATCHSTNYWTPATFDHNMVLTNNSTLKNQCTDCHTSPKNDLHNQAKMSCSECHTTDYWTPATFEHNDYFRFDKHHTSDCTNCHTNNNYKQYTCYSCHEHSKRKIKLEHIEEGIFNYSNCVECHKSGDEHEAKRIWKYLKRLKGYPSNNFKREYKKHDDD